MRPSQRERCLLGPLHNGTSHQYPLPDIQTQLITSRHFIYRQGDPVQYLYIIRQGSAKIGYHDKTGHESICDYALVGDTLGLEGLYENTHPTYAMAPEDSRVCRIERDAFRLLLRKHLSLQERLYHQLSSALLRQQQQHHLLTIKQAEQRLACFLYDYTQRLANAEKQSKVFKLVISRKDLACYLGLRQETISRLFRHLCEEGVLSIDKRLIQITKPNTLQSKAEGTCCSN